MARIGDVAHMNHINRHLQDTQTRMRAAQTEVATGKAATRYSEIHDEATLLISSKQQQGLARQFIGQNEALVDRMRAMDGALANVGDLTEKFRSLLMQRLDSSTGQEIPLEHEVDSIMSEMAAQLNLRLDDRYLFSGSRTDRPAIELPDQIDGPADLADIYKGDAILPEVRADSDVVLEYGVSANAFTGVFELFAEAKEAHLAGDTAALQGLVDEVPAAIDTVADRRGKLGADMARVEAVTGSQRASLDYLDDIVSRIEDADLADAFSRMAQDQVGLEAAYLTVSRLNSLSLAEFLR